VARKADWLEGRPPVANTGPAAVVVPAPRGVAHSPQNASPGSHGAPHDGHAAASGVAHWTQNFRPGLFSVPQLAQIT